VTVVRSLIAVAVLLGLATMVAGAIRPPAKH
jgi:hypothetical protein